MPVIPTPRKERHQDQEVKVILSYLGSSRSAWATVEIVSKNKSEKKYILARKRHIELHKILNRASLMWNSVVEHLPNM